MRAPAGGERGRTTVPASSITAGAVLPIDLAGEEWVLWRGSSGRAGVAPRRCPHLGEDLAAAIVVGEELVCPSHGWCLTLAGRAGKRTERGRFDDKGDLGVPTLEERDGQLVISS